MNAKRLLVGSVYQPGRRVQFWHVEYDVGTRTARLGFELIAMNEPRENLGETWYPFDEARSLLHPDLWDFACKQLSKLQSLGNED